MITSFGPRPSVPTSSLPSKAQKPTTSVTGKRVESHICPLLKRYVAQESSFRIGTVSCQHSVVRCSATTFSRTNPLPGTRHFGAIGRASANSCPLLEHHPSLAVSDTQGEASSTPKTHEFPCTNHGCIRHSKSHFDGVRVERGWIREIPHIERSTSRSLHSRGRVRSFLVTLQPRESALRFRSGWKEDGLGRYHTSNLRLHGHCIRGEGSGCFL